MLLKYKTDSERTWQVMKEISGKQKTRPNLFPREIKASKICRRTLPKNLTIFLLLLEQKF